METVLEFIKKDRFEVRKKGAYPGLGEMIGTITMDSAGMCNFIAVQATLPSKFIREIASRMAEIEAHL